MAKHTGGEWKARVDGGIFIAAAPDLLAACKGMADVARDILASLSMDLLDKDDPDYQRGLAARAMLAAIAKAEGK